MECAFCILLEGCAKTIPYSPVSMTHLFVPELRTKSRGVSDTWVSDYHNFNVTWHQVIKAKFGFVLHTDEYGSSM